MKHNKLFSLQLLAVGFTDLVAASEHKVQDACISGTPIVFRRRTRSLSFSTSIQLPLSTHLELL
jgi:hypothetical protein